MAKTKQDATKRHTWHARMKRDQEPRTYEFGMAITKQDAENRIAKLHGMKSLPGEAVVSWRELEKLAPEPAPAPEKKEKT